MRDKRTPKDVCGEATNGFNCLNRNQYHRLRSRNKQQGAQRVTLTKFFLTPATQYSLSISQYKAQKTYTRTTHSRGNMKVICADMNKDNLSNNEGFLSF